MSYMFSESKFNQDISNWNVGNVTDMSWLFYRVKFNKSISNWFLNLNKNCNLKCFINNKNIKINSYEDFKQYHRKLVLKKL